MPKPLLTNRTDIDRIAARLQASRERARKAALRRLAYIGEAAVVKARERGSYTDRTGNLRSSVGYVVLDDGKQVRQGKPAEYKNASDGPKQWRKLTDAVRSQYPSGLVLIVAAGMHYAAYVENIHGRDVLASAELEAEKLFNQLIARQ